MTASVREMCTGSARKNGTKSGDLGVLLWDNLVIGEFPVTSITYAHMRKTTRYRIHNVKGGHTTS